MDLSNLKPAAGSVKTNTRYGRGEGSGKGGTSARGHKGAQSRSGYSRKIGFEGGQMPLQRRVPKRGFKNVNRVEYRVFNLDHLQAIAEKLNTTTIDVDLLRSANYIKKSDVVKVLGRGEISTKIDVTVHAASATAKAAIEAAGGAVNIIG